MSEKLFRFSDGEKPVQVGQTVLIINSNRNGKAEELRITKIGRTLMHVGEGYGALAFYFNGKEKSNYCRNSIYSSKAAYDECLEKEKIALDIHRYASMGTLRLKPLKVLELILELIKDNE